MPADSVRHRFDKGSLRALLLSQFGGLAILFCFSFPLIHKTFSTKRRWAGGCSRPIGACESDLMVMDRSSVTVPKPPKRNVIRIKVGSRAAFFDLATPLICQGNGATPARASCVQDGRMQALQRTARGRDLRCHHRAGGCTSVLSRYAKSPCWSGRQKLLKALVYR